MLLYTLDNAISTGRSIFFPAKACASSTLYALCLTFGAVVNLLRASSIVRLSALAHLCIALRYMTPAIGSRLFGSLASSGGSFPHGFESH